MTIRIDLKVLFAFAAGVAVAVILLFVFGPWRAEATPGDTDATFVPVTACRLIDTRPDTRVGPHTAFGPDDTKTLVVSPSLGNCTVPGDAVGLSLNVTAVGATAPTFVTIWPDGPRPEASSLNPAPGQPPTPNAVMTQLSGERSFEVYNLQGRVDLLIDVTGYYTNASLVELDARMVELDERVAELEALTASMSLESVDGASTVRFSGVNV